MISARRSRLVLGALALTLAAAAGCGGGQGLAATARNADAQTQSPSLASLSFHPVLGPGDAAALTPADEVDPTRELTLLDDEGQPLRLGPAALTEQDMAGAAVESHQGQHLVTVDFSSDGARRWSELTGAAACNPPQDPSRRVAIVLDGEVLSSPQVHDSIPCDVGIVGGSTQITGDFTAQEAQDLVALITSA